MALPEHNSLNCVGTEDKKVVVKDKIKLKRETR